MWKNEEEEWRKRRTSSIQRHPHLMKNIAREPFLGMARLGLCDLRFLLCAIGDFELRVEDVHPAGVLLRGAFCFLLSKG